MHDKTKNLDTVKKVDSMLAVAEYVSWKLVALGTGFLAWTLLYKFPDLVRLILSVIITIGVDFGLKDILSLFINLWADQKENKEKGRQAASIAVNSTLIMLMVVFAPRYITTISANALTAEPVSEAIVTSKQDDYIKKSLSLTEMKETERKQLFSYAREIVKTKKTRIQEVRIDYDSRIVSAIKKGSTQWQANYAMQGSQADSWFWTCKKCASSFRAYRNNIKDLMRQKNVALVKERVKTEKYEDILSGNQSYSSVTDEQIAILNDLAKEENAKYKNKTANISKTLNILNIFFALISLVSTIARTFIGRLIGRKPKTKTLSRLTKAIWEKLIDNIIGYFEKKFKIDINKDGYIGKPSEKPKGGNDNGSERKHNGNHKNHNRENGNHNGNHKKHHNQNHQPKKKKPFHEEDDTEEFQKGVKKEWEVINKRRNGNRPKQPYLRNEVDTNKVADEILEKVTAGMAKVREEAVSKVKNIPEPVVREIEVERVVEIPKSIHQIGFRQKKKVETFVLPNDKVDVEKLKKSARANKVRSEDMKVPEKTRQANLAKWNAKKNKLVSLGVTQIKIKGELIQISKY